MNNIPKANELDDMLASDDAKDAPVTEGKKKEKEKKLNPDQQAKPVMNDDQMKLYGPRIYLHPIPSGFLALFAVFVNSLVVNIGEQKCVTYLKGIEIMKL